MVSRAIVRFACAGNETIVNIQGIYLELAAKQFFMDKNIIPFTKREYQLLELFFLNKGKFVTREKCMNHLYNYDEEPEQKIIDVLVCKIRQRLVAYSASKGIVETVRGQGYRTISVHRHVRDC